MSFDPSAAINAAKPNERITLTGPANVPSKTFIVGDPLNKPVLVSPKSALRIGQGVSQVRVSGIAGDVGDKQRAVVDCSGSDVHVSDVESVGRGRILQLDGVTRFTADGITST